MWEVVNMMPSKDEWIKALNDRHGEDLQNKKRELVIQAERKVRPSTENLIWIMPT